MPDDVTQTARPLSLKDLFEFYAEGNGYTCTYNESPCGCYLVEVAAQDGTPRGYGGAVAEGCAKEIFSMKSTMASILVED